VVEGEENVLYARLLREAAGASAADWVMGEADERSAIHQRGLCVLVEAAGWCTARWLRLGACIKVQSDILLSGATALGVSTEWEGWP
jgi:hypothetical protein